MSDQPRTVQEATLLLLLGRVGELISAVENLETVIPKAVSVVTNDFEAPISKFSTSIDRLANESAGQILVVGAAIEKNAKAVNSFVDQLNGILGAIKSSIVEISNGIEKNNSTFDVHQNAFKKQLSNYMEKAVAVSNHAIENANKINLNFEQLEVFVNADFIKQVEQTREELLAANESTTKATIRIENATAKLTSSLLGGAGQYLPFISAGLFFSGLVVGIFLHKLFV